MELNDEPEDGAPSAASGTPDDEVEVSAKSKDIDEAKVEARFEAELEADVAEYKTELVGEEAEDKLKVEKEAIAREYDAPYIPAESRDEAKQSLVRRLSPYLTVAGVLLILRIVFYSLRRRRR
jgi:hypothetical protein